MEAVELNEWFCVMLLFEPSNMLGRWRVVVIPKDPRLLDDEVKVFKLNPASFALFYLFP